MEMQEYRPKHPLERLLQIDPKHYWRYPNLLQDESGKILSDHIMYIKPEEAKSHPLITEFEAQVKKMNSNIELAFNTTSGNAWIFLKYSGALNHKNLDQLQETYEKLVCLTN